jgi:hypothetical protein
MCLFNHFAVADFDGIHNTGCTRRFSLSSTLRLSLHH